ncbi:MAG: phage holin family protein [Candidatus Krumholzibacteriia bacterium]
MNPLIDERAQAVGEGVRDFAKMHVDLARAEVRDGSTRFVWGMFLAGLGVMLGTLAFLTAGASLFLTLRSVLSAPASAGVVALVFLGLGFVTFRLGQRLMAGIGSLLLPRTRAMLWELVTWRENKSDS